MFLKPLCWTEALSSLRDRITALTGYKFRIVIGNQYRTGTDSIGWHADNESSMGFNPAMPAAGYAYASISLGSCRKFQIKPIGGRPTDFWLQDKPAKTKTERHQQRKAELSRRYEVEVTPDLVEKDDDGWYPQLRMHYYLTLGREFLTNRDTKRAKAQLEAEENSIWKPDFNKGQMLPQYFSVKGERGRGKGERKTFNPNPVTFSQNPIPS